jgi:8-oxo-dGTP pyrophosphatase MutT (NUDIX family)
MRLGYRVAYRLLHVWARIARPHGQGVKCLLTDDAGRTVFVRHHYGERSQWELPGGGVKRGEAAADAARREACEELGADVAQWQRLGAARGEWYGKHEALTVFAATWPGGPVRPDPVEIAVVGWFGLDDPPAPLGPTTIAALRVVGR